MPVLAPGNILQLMFLKKQIAAFEGKTFLEVGPGSGNLTEMLLKKGLKGTLVELSKVSCDQLASRFVDQTEEGKLIIKNVSFLSEPINEKFDLILSAMVLEHLSDTDEKKFLEKCKDSLATNGVLMLLVPANPKYWGIEDEIAGHFRRYTEMSLFQVVNECNLHVEEIRGLTFPLSNMLLPISNFFVKRSESSKTQLDMHHRTLESGHRNVIFKTVFPIYFGLILNSFVLYPFFIAQKIFRNNPKSLILFLRARSIF
jgi:phospholipid N-methyltransferase